MACACRQATQQRYKGWMARRSCCASKARQQQCHGAVRQLMLPVKDQDTYAAVGHSCIHYTWACDNIRFHNVHIMTSARPPTCNVASSPTPPCCCSRPLPPAPAPPPLLPRASAAAEVGWGCPLNRPRRWSTVHTQALAMLLTSCTSTSGDSAVTWEPGRQGRGGRTHSTCDGAEWCTLQQAVLLNALLTCGLA
jgi:hypothetical protein